MKTYINLSAGLLASEYTKTIKVHKEFVDV
jgi:hypothetical protein